MTNTLSSRIDAAMREANINQAELARRAGVTSGAVAQWISGDVKALKASVAIRVADALNVTIHWLVDGHGQMHGTNGSILMPTPGDPGPDFVPVTRVNIKVSAGITGFAIEHLSGNGMPIFFRRDWIETRGYRADRLYALKVSGDSMEPNLWNGDLVVMNSDATSPKDGEVFVANYEGEVIIKRLRRDSGSWWLDSDNARHKPKRCDEHAELLGQVIYKQSERI